jgi:hypothetical protein
MDVSKDDIKKLIDAPVEFAILMENDQIDYVLEKFLDVRNTRNKYREDYMKPKCQDESKAQVQ